MSFHRGELAARLEEEERRVLDNFLRRMRTLGALEIDLETRGGYRFPNRLYALYFGMQAPLQPGRR